MTLTPDDGAASAQLIGAAICQVADLQRTAIERLEVKATVLFGFVATAVPLFAAQHAENAVLRAFAFAAYAVAGLAALVAARPYMSGETPPPRDFVWGFLADPQPPVVVARWLMASRVVAYEENECAHRLKGGLTWIALVAFVVAAVLSVWSVLL
jgi:hypothetical protein